MKEYKKEFKDPLDMLSMDKSTLFLNDKKYILDERKDNGRHR